MEVKIAAGGGGGAGGAGGDGLVQTLVALVFWITNCD